MRSLDDVFAAAEGAAEETLAILRDLIQIPTVNTGIMPTGNEVAACDYISQKLGSDGVEVEVLHSAQGRANAIAELRGTRGNPRMLFLSHTDVVPSGDESEWRYPPFSGKVADGRVWGRGAADMKDTLAAQIMAVLLLKRAGLTLGGGIRLVACADEETGGQYGIRWMAEHAPKMLCADYALNEGGGTPVTVDGKLAYLLPVGEKGRLEARITFRGTATHASTPWQGDNVLFKLDRVLQRIGALEPSLDVSHAFFGRIAELMGLAEPIVQANVNAVADALASRYPGVASNLRGHSRLTLVPTMVAGGVKSNSVPSVCSLVCDVRTLPDQNEAFVRGILDGLVAEIEGATYTLEYTAVPSASSPQSELAASLQRVTEAATGHEDIHMVPCLTTGFTDSRVVRPFGTVVYGFTPEHPSVDPTINCGIHGPNESTDIASLVFRTKVLAGVAWDLLRDGG